MGQPFRIRTLPLRKAAMGQRIGREKPPERIRFGTSVIPDFTCKATDRTAVILPFEPIARSPDVVLGKRKSRGESPFVHKRRGRQIRAGHILARQHLGKHAAGQEIPVRIEISRVP